MKAITQARYGSPEVLEFTDVNHPAPKDREVLVRVQAASAHPGDWHLMTGRPYLIRVMGFGLRAPKTTVRGIDVTGYVETVGPGVTQFQPGDAVFGSGTGTFAEYACAPEKTLAPVPAGLSFAQAATLPTSATSALQGLRDVGNLQPGQRVLITGAGGGVGTFAVQIAKAYGAEVTGVCSTTKVELVRSIGADHVIDYTREDFTGAGDQYDLILDTAGNRPLSQLRRALSRTGTLVMVGGEASGGGFFGGFDRQMLWAPLRALFTRQRLRSLVAKDRQQDLLAVTELVEAGKLTPVIDRTYALVETPEALRYIEDGHARGKVVIAVQDAEVRP